MAKFSKTGKQSTFTKTEYKLTDEELRKKNSEAYGIVQQYDEKIASGGYLSAEDLYGYQEAKRTYIDTGNAIRKRLTENGYKFTDADEADWATQVAGLNDRYDQVYGVYSPHTSEDSWKAHLEEVKEYEENKTLDIPAAEIELDELRKQYNAALEQEKNEKPSQSYLFTGIGGGDTSLPLFVPAGHSSGVKKASAVLQERITALEKRIEDATAIQLITDYESVSDPTSENYDPEFETKSVYDPTKRSPQKAGGILGLTSTYDSDPYLLYAAINGDEDAIAQLQANAGASGASSPEGYNALGGLYFSMTEGKHELANLEEEEKKTYNYLAHEYGIAKANEYYALIRSDLFARERYADLLEMQAYTKEHPVAASASTWLMAPLKGLSYMGQAIDYIDDGRIDENAPYNKFTYTGSDIRNTRAGMIEESWDNALGEGWGKVGSWGYQLGMSMGDFVMATAVSGGNQFMSLAIMGTGAAADTTIAAKQRGLSDDQAFALGTIAGAAEVITEKIGLDELFDVALKGKSSLVYLLKNAFSEGLEEPTSSVINTLADLIISGDKAELAMKVQEYRDAGASEGAAVGKVLGEYGLSLLGDAAGGMLSGGFMAIPGTISQSTQYRDVGAKIIKKGTASELKAAADTLGVITNKFNLSKPGQVGQLYYTVAEKISESGKEALTGEMVKNGVSKKAATKLSGVIIDAWMGVEVGESGMDLLASALKDDNITGAMEVVLNGENSQVRIARDQLSGVMEGDEVETVAEDTAEKTPESMQEIEPETFEDVQVEDGALGDVEQEIAPEEVQGEEAYSGTALKDWLAQNYELDVDAVGGELPKTISDHENDFRDPDYRAAFESSLHPHTRVRSDGSRLMDYQDTKAKVTSLLAAMYMGEKAVAERSRIKVVRRPAAQEQSEQREEPATTDNDVDGKTFLESTGEEVKSISVKSIGKGGAVVTVNGGTEASLRDVSFGDERTHLAYSRVTSVDGMTAAAANKILNNPKAERFDFINEAIRAFQGGLRNDGKIADKLDYKLLTATEAREFYEEGRKAAEADIKAREAVVKAKEKAAAEESSTTAKKGGVFYGYDGQAIDQRKSLTKSQRVAVDFVKRLAKKFGSTFYFYESYVDENGNRVYKDRDGNIQEAKKGFYDPKDGSIHIDLNGDNILFTVSHELVHFIRDWSPRQFGKMADLVMEGFNRQGLTAEELIEAKQAEYAADGIELTEEQAFEEVIAASLEGIMADGRVMEFLKAAEAKDKGLGAKIKKFFQDICQLIRDTIDSYKDAEPSSAEGRLIRKMDDVYRQLQEAFAEGVYDAGENFRKAESTTGEGGVRYNKAEKKKDSSQNKNITMHDVLRLRGIGRKSVSSFSSEIIQIAQKWADKYYKDLGSKSPFFRNWFGDWRTVDKTPVTIVKIPVVGLSKEDFKLFVKNQRGTVINEDTKKENGEGWEVRISSEGERNTQAHAGGAGLSVDALTAIRALIENGILLDTEVHEHHSNNSKSESTDRIAFDHKLYSLGINSDNSIALYRITIEEIFQDVKHPHDKRFHNLKYIEKVADNIPGLTYAEMHSADTVRDISATKYTVADLYEFVKQHDPEFNEGTTSSKVTETNGKPLIMYHGTRAENGDFYIFDESQAKRKGGLGFKALGKGNYFTAKKLDGTERYGSRVIAAYLDIKSPFVYNGGMSFREQVSNDLGIDAESMSYDEIQAAMRQKGYDGVIEYDKAGNVLIAVTFDSNQIKSVENVGTFDGANPDIRYSVGAKTDKAAQEAVERENARLREDVARLTALLKLQGKVTNGTVFTPSSVEAAARYLKKNAGAKGDTKALAKLLNDFYEYIATQKELTWEDVREKAKVIANWLMDHVEHKRSDYAQEILDQIRGSRIRLDESQKAEVVHQYGSYGSYRKSLMGSITLSKDAATSLDSWWQEMATMYPDVFDAEISAADLPSALGDIVYRLRNENSSALEYEHNRRWIEQDLIRDVYDSYWRVSNLRTVADRYAAQINRLRGEHVQRMNELRAESRQKMEQLKLQHRAEVDMIRRAYRDRMEKQRRELSEQYRESRQRAVSRVRETAEKRDAVKKMQALVLDCIRWIDHPKKDEIRCPDVLKKPLAEFLSGIDTASKQMSKGGDPTINDLKMANAMHKLAAAIERISKDQSPKDSEDGENGAESDPILDGGYLDLPSDFVQTLREMASEITEMMSNDGYIINEMTAAEVRQLSQLIRTLRHAIREMGTLYANQRFANIQVLGRESVEFMDGLGEIEKSGGLKDFAQWQNALPWYAFKRFGSAGESIFEEMMDGQDKLAFLARELFAFQKKNWSAQEAKMWGEDVHTIELPSGGEITLTTADAMSIFCISRRRIDGRDHGMQHLTGGGVRVIGLQKGSKKAKDSRANLSVQDVAEIVNSLTDRQKEVATAIQQFMSSVCAEWGNEIFMKRFLTKNFTEQFYFPIESNDENLTAQDPSRPQSDMFRLLNISATKPTTPRANNQVIIRNIFDVFTNHATDMAKLNAFGMPLLDYMKWVNYRQKTENQEGQINVTGVRRSMNTAYGSAAWQYVMNLIKDVNGRPSDGGLPGFYKRMLQNAKTAMVGNNLRVATLQVTAYPRAGLVLSSKSLALGLTKSPGKGIQKAKKYCGIALWKSFGFYDTDIAKTMEEQIKGTTDVRRKMIEWSLKGAELGDAITWGALWNACEYEVAATKLYEVGSEEFYHAVALKLREVVYRTQVVDSILTRSETMRSKNAKMKELSSFMSEPTVSANILMDAGFTFSMEKRRYGSAKLAWKNTRRYITRSISVYAIGQLSAALVEALWDTIRSDEDDEEKWEIFLKALGENLVLDLLPFNKIPIVSEFAEAAMSMIGLGYYSTDSLASTGLSQTVSAIGMWAKFGDGKASNDPSVYKAIYKTMQALSSLTGIAGASAMRDLVALWNLIMGAIDEDLKIE